MSKRFIVASVLFLSVVVLLGVKVNFDFCGDYEGVFLLRGEEGNWLEVTDDLFPEDVDRYLGGFALTRFKQVISNGWCADTGECTNFEWNKTSGRGFIKTRFPDNRKLLICLSRFKDDDNKMSRGLFLGGNLPPTDPDAEIFNRNESGMAYFDGKRYYHIWCNVNEGIIDNSNKLSEPGSWDFLESQILEDNPRDLTLSSKHSTLVNNVPVTVERFLFYETGDVFVTLVTKLTNVGQAATSFSYMYGDEPWVGNYGTSAGDVGWLKDRMVTTETRIDTKGQSYAGIFDYGNELAGEQHVYTKQANFIEWQQVNGPSVAYFSNQFGSVAEPQAKVPLSSHTNRVIALEWGKLLLQPKASFTFKIAVGMASYDPKLNLPIKPYTGLN